jgi:hypothetical protein
MNMNTNGIVAAHPAGWVSPEEAEAAGRLAVGREIAREQEEAARAAREQAITERIARQHVPAAEPREPVQPPGEDGRVAKAYLPPRA